MSISERFFIALKTAVYVVMTCFFFYCLAPKKAATPEQLFVFEATVKIVLNCL